MTKDKSSLFWKSRVVMKIYTQSKKEGERETFSSLVSNKS